MQSEFTNDVLISGAGAAGLALAIELARRGVNFRLIDKAPEPFQGSRGKGVQPRTLEVFEDMGILNRTVARGGPVPLVCAYAEDGSSRHGTNNDAPSSAAEPYTTPLMLPQFLTELTMRERLLELGHRVEFGCELVAFEQDDAGVTVRLAGRGGEQSSRVRYLVGTDGGKSFVRHSLGIDFPGGSLGIRAIVADVELTGCSRDLWHQWQNGTPEQIALCPLPGTDLFTLQAAALMEGEPDVSVQGLNELLATRTHRPDLKIHSVVWSSVYNMSQRLAAQFRVGRVFIAGDAAHVHPPSGGQGLNTSIQDSYNLGWKLAAALAGAPDSLLASYETERQTNAAAMLQLAVRMLEEVKKRGIARGGREVRQLDIGYHESPLNLEQPPAAARVHAGDRAPDAPCKGAAGQALRLFDLYRGTHWTLLEFNTGTTESEFVRPGLRIHAIGPQGEIIDDAGHINAAYGAPAGTRILIRPDGYIGAVVGSDESARLDSYLNAVGLSN